MLLDVVLSEPHAEWIATEAEKVALFTERFGVRARTICHAGPSSPRARIPHTTRRFKDKLPIALVGDPPVVHSST